MTNEWPLQQLLNVLTSAVSDLVNGKVSVEITPITNDAKSVVGTRVKLKRD